VSKEPELSTRRILALWWPLASSWLLMGIELPLFTACVARMSAPEVNLAAYGSLVFPIALVIEAPIMMLLAAATALAGDRESWARVRGFMHKASACLTALHVVVAFTPLFDWLAGSLFGVPAEVVEPARLGLRIMTPWTWSIAYRRTHQGVLIRHERSRPVMIGTFLRLTANATVYALGFALLRHGIELPGIAVGAAAVASGVLSEAVFIGWCTRALLSERPLPASPGGVGLTHADFLRFYVPLALTPLIALVTQPIGAAAMAHMRDPLLSLAAWPAVHGLLFLVRTGGFAYNEVVLSLLSVPGSRRALRRFGLQLGAVSSACLFLLAATPLATLWFDGVMGLPEAVGALAVGAVALGVFWPFLQALQSWLQGSLTHLRRTRYVTEAMLVFFVVIAAAFYFGVCATDWRGVRFVVLALSFANLCQLGWLAVRYRGTRARGASDPAQRTDSGSLQA
jgi:Na+-driven multidrug efflux pump